MIGVPSEGGPLAQDQRGFPPARQEMVQAGRDRDSVSLLFILARAQRRVFKDDSNRHAALRRHENRFLRLTSVWKQVFRG